MSFFSGKTPLKSEPHPTRVYNTGPSANTMTDPPLVVTNPFPSPNKAPAPKAPASSGGKARGVIAALVALAAGWALVANKDNIGQTISKPTPPPVVKSAEPATPDVPVPSPAVPTPPPVVQPPTPVVPSTPAPVTPTPTSSEPDRHTADKSLETVCLDPMVKHEYYKTLNLPDPTTGKRVEKKYALYKYDPESRKGTYPPTVPSSAPPTPIVTPPAPSGPQVVVVQPPPTPETKGPVVMYGFKGLGGLFDEAAFTQFAKEMGYVPVVVKAWNEEAAINEVLAKLSDDPYALYGFSMGADTAQKFVANMADVIDRDPNKRLPDAVYTIGASSAVSLKGLSKVKVVKNYYHTNTVHDTDGEFVKAPHSGAGNIQQAVADMFKKG